MSVPFLYGLWIGTVFGVSAGAFLSALIGVVLAFRFGALSPWDALFRLKEHVPLIPERPES